MYDVLHSHLVNLAGSNACPTVTATPETVKAAFTKESDIFAENGVFIYGFNFEPSGREDLRRPDVQGMGPVLGLSREENERAVAVGFHALHECEAEIRR
jgi:predicted nucleotide-binding protein (sugar kinase/HSP70/actin superfamily)